MLKHSTSQESQRYLKNTNIFSGKSLQPTKRNSTASGNRTARLPVKVSIFSKTAALSHGRTDSAALTGKIFRTKTKKSQKHVLGRNHTAIDQIYFFGDSLSLNKKKSNTYLKN